MASKIVGQRTAEPGIVIRLFGAPSIVTSTGPLAPAKPLVFAAALYLGLHRGRTIRREALATVLWPDVTDAKRGERMRWLVRQLRLAGLPLASGAAEITLARSHVVLDTDLLATAPSASEAIALVNANLLAGYDPQISDLFERWVDETRATYRDDVLRTLSEWLLTTRRSGAWQSVAAIARCMLMLDDGRADAIAALAEAVVRQGVSPVEGVRDEREARALIGREIVLARITEALSPSSGAGHRLAIAGPAGIGKSRLLEELARRATARGIPVATVRCQRGEALRPLSLAIDLTRALLQLPGALGASPTSIGVLHRFIGEQPSPDDGESPEARRTAVYDAMRDLVGAVTDEAGLVVVVDDAQWAEPGSWALLAPAFTHRTPAPLCWAVTIRADSREEALQAFDTSFPRDDAVSEQERELLWLTPLETTDVVRLCAERAAPRVIPDHALTVLTVRAAGIPFIAEALVDHWLELGDVSSLPPSVTRLVRSRLDRLTHDATKLLRAIAVLGLDATPPGAEAVAPLGRRELIDAVATLELSGILRTVNGMLWSHALWTEAALASMPPATAQLIHRNAAEWLEQKTIATEPRHHWAVATHWIEAGDREKAQRALDYSANLLAGNGFIVEAAHMLEQAGGLAGVSTEALQCFERAAQLWRQSLGIDAIDALSHLNARYNEVTRALHGDNASVHHEVESLLNFVTIRNGVEADWQMIVRTWLNCAVAEDASRLHRLTATANLLYRYRRSRLHSDTVTSVWRTVSTLIPTNEREALEYEHCAAEFYSRIAGQHDLANTHIARALAIVTTNDEFGAVERIRTASRASEYYERIGNVPASLAILHDTVAHGRRLNNKYIVESAMSSVLGTLLELGRAAEARLLLADYGRVSPDITAHSNYDRGRVIYWAVCALEEGNAPLARAEMTVSLAEGEKSEGVAGARILSIYAHLALLENDDAMLARLLPQLLSRFTVGRFMDHPALITALALERLEGWEAAAEFVRRFVHTIREEHSTPRAELLRFLASDADTSASEAREGAAPSFVR